MFLSNTNKKHMWVQRHHHIWPRVTLKGQNQGRLHIEWYEICTLYIYLLKTYLSGYQIRECGWAGLSAVPAVFLLVQINSGEVNIQSPRVPSDLILNCHTNDDDEMMMMMMMRRRRRRRKRRSMRWWRRRTTTTSPCTGDTLRDVICGSLLVSTLLISFRS